MSLATSYRAMYLQEQHLNDKLCNGLRSVPGQDWVVDTPHSWQSIVALSCWTAGRLPTRWYCVACMSMRPTTGQSEC